MTESPDWLDDLNQRTENELRDQAAAFRRKVRALLRTLTVIALITLVGVALLVALAVRAPQ